MGPYNAPTIAEPFTIQDFYMKQQQAKHSQSEAFEDIPNTTQPHTTQPQVSNNQEKKVYIAISPYLEKFVKLWVWDWDDTLIDIGAYVRHSMDRETILALTDTELEFDVPNWLYFRNLVNYLVSSGRRVGIASFGTYSIIRAYMDRIFGFGQKIFTEVNIYAACQSIDRVCMPRSMPVNKNAYIQRLMKQYAIDNPKVVTLFDDNSTNIADCARMGVIPIQIQSLNSVILDNGSYGVSIKYSGNTPAGDARNNLAVKRAILFGPAVMADIESRIRKMCQSNPLEYDKQFGQLGDFKTMKRQERMVGDIVNRTLEPNFNLDAFINLGHGEDFNDLKTTETEKQKLRKHKSPEEQEQERIAKEKARKTKFINSELEGFKVERDGFDNYNIIDDMSTCVSGLLSGSVDKCIPITMNGEGQKEGFATCMSCKSPATTWFACGLFLIMVGLIVAMFYL
jgi:hypothetical protein